MQKNLNKFLQQNDLQMIKLLGKGMYGKVYQVKKGSQKYALKIMQMKQLQQVNPQYKEFLTEYQLLKKIKNEYVVKVIQLVKSNDFIGVLLEYCKLGNLKDYQNRQQKRVFQPQKAIEIVSQILKGLQCIHNQQIVHRDLKLQNILVDLVSMENKKTIFKIADFGFASDVSRELKTTFCGTMGYMAPQIHNDEPYGLQVDIWSLGAIFYFLLNGQIIFKSQNYYQKCLPKFDYKKQVQNSKNKLIHNITPQLCDLFSKIFQIQPENRIKFQQIRQHPVFKGYFTQKQVKQCHVIYKEANQQISCYVRKSINVKNQAKNFENNKNNNQTKKKTNIKQQMNPITQQPNQQEKVSQNTNNNQIKYNISQNKDINKLSIRKSSVIFIHQLVQYLFRLQQQSQNWFQEINYIYIIKYWLIRLILYYINIGSKKIEQCQQQNFTQKDIKQILNEYKNYKKQSLKILNQNKNFILKSAIKFDQKFKSDYKMIDNITLQFNDKLFDDFKYPYRIMTINMFKEISKQIHQKFDTQPQNKLKQMFLIKFKIFFLHSINNILAQEEVVDNFKQVLQYKKKQNIKNPNEFDFISFNNWLKKCKIQDIKNKFKNLNKKYFY